MPVTLRYLGWSAFEIVLEDRRRIALDPLIKGVPEQDVPPSPAQLEEFDGVDVVMVTHAAGDHLGQAFDILRRGRAKLVCDVASRVLALAAGIAQDRIISMVPGVRFDFSGLLVKALPAQHLSFRQLGENAYISAPPLSYLVTTPGNARIFFGGDTSISKDHQLFGQLYKPHVAVLGVGGVKGAMGQSFTELYPDEAALVAKWLKVKTAIPIHYRFDEGERFAKELKRCAPTVRAVLLKPGECFHFPRGKKGKPCEDGSAGKGRGGGHEAC
jgi:L-ascorbate metabolism protein UlaG (beta-lactamase superfamily)